jgi:hypothetical protein
MQIAQPEALMLCVPRDSAGLRLALEDDDFADTAVAERGRRCEARRPPSDDGYVDLLGGQMDRSHSSATG